MNAFQTIGVIARRRDPHNDRSNLETVTTLIETLKGFCRDVLLDETLAPTLPHMLTVSRAELGRRCDLVIVVGGDGTLLDAGRSLAPANIPLLGVQGGRLGFLADVQVETLQDTLAEILAGEYVEEQRIMLSMRTLDKGHVSVPQVAVNDVVLSNQASIRMVEFETWSGSDFISLHRADGMIVSTPTGSTAYALSGGGPVMHPTLPAIALVPICPHTLSDRPIVIGADKPVKIVIRGDARTQAMITCDGQVNTPVAVGAAVIITRAEKPMRLIHPKNYDYFHILREKLRWGRGPEKP